MNGGRQPREDEQDDEASQKFKFRVEKRRWTWQGVGAVIGLTCGVITIIFGTVFTAISWLMRPEGYGLSLQRIGTLLFFLSFPLLIFGAHCLDLLESASHSSTSLAGMRKDDSELETDPHNAKSRDGRQPNVTGALLFLTAFLGLPVMIQAQQTVFNVPNTDVLPRGSVYGELDISAKPNEPKFSSFAPRIVVGVGGSTEVGLNLTGNIQPGPDSTTLVTAVKWKVYDGRDNGWAVVIGDNFHIPVRNRSYRVGNHFYTQFSKTLKTKTRLSFGGYYFTEHVVAPNAQRVGGQFSFEQPVTKRFGVQADWLTGRHASGYFTSGSYFKITQKLTGYAAYSIGNANVTNGNHFFYGELGFNFD